MPTVFLTKDEGRTTNRPPSSVIRRPSKLFGLSATATASAALSLVLTVAGTPSAALKGLERRALGVSGAELAMTAATERAGREHGLAAPRRRQPLQGG